MENDQIYWNGWIHAIQRWNLGGIVAFFLQSTGPLSVVMAQLVYMGQPLFATSPGDARWSALGRLLESQSSRNQFVSCLHEEAGR